MYFVIKDELDGDCWVGPAETEACFDFINTLELNLLFILFLDKYHPVRNLKTLNSEMDYGLKHYFRRTLEEAKTAVPLIST